MHDPRSWQGSAVENRNVFRLLTIPNPIGLYISASEQIVFWLPHPEGSYCEKEYCLPSRRLSQSPKSQHATFNFSVLPAFRFSTGQETITLIDATWFRFDAIRILGGVQTRPRGFLNGKTGKFGGTHPRHLQMSILSNQICQQSTIISSSKHFDHLYAPSGAQFKWGNNFQLSLKASEVKDLYSLSSSYDFSLCWLWNSAPEP